MNWLEVKRALVRDALRANVRGGYSLRLFVRDAMTAAPSCIAGDTSVLDVVKMYHAKEFRHLPVTDACGRLLGVVSDRDVIRCFGPGRYPNPEALSSISAVEIMSSDLITTSPGTPLTEALSQMLSHGISCLPVLTDDKLVGILTNTDMHLVLDVLLQEAPVDAASIGSGGRQAGSQFQPALA